MSPLNRNDKSYWRRLSKEKMLRNKDEDDKKVVRQETRTSHKRRSSDSGRMQVERGRRMKCDDWLKAFERKKEGWELKRRTESDRRFRHTSKSETGSESEDELNGTKSVVVELKKKLIRSVDIRDEIEVPEPVWKETSSGSTLPAWRMKSICQESDSENTWGSDSPPKPGCGGLLRFVQQFQKETAKKPEEVGEVVMFVHGCVVRVKEADRNQNK
eukprot:GFUD01027822.1.p1 GENE.GFUD01027822.1~~GFUD01027822.1.p1  ORF type:complete len:215 (+),score=70.84 GFUD01027822.1:47-691(+)